jgi:hypothetical protein
MKKLLSLVALVALVGCAGRPTIRGVHFNSDGALVNGSGTNLHRVTMEGEMWTHGGRIDLWPQKLGDWPDGDTLTMHWRMESVDRIDIYGRCKEGKFYAVFPSTP